MAGRQTVLQSPLGTHFLRKLLVNCSSSAIGHYRDIDSVFVQDSAKIHLKAVPALSCVRQETSVLAHRVIHSVSCTQRGLSPLVSLLLACKECVCVYIMHMHMQECVCVCVCVCALMHAYVPVHTGDNSSGHSCSPYSPACPVTTGM